MVSKQPLGSLAFLAVLNESVKHSGITLLSILAALKTP